MTRERVIHNDHGGGTAPSRAVLALGGDVVVHEYGHALEYFIIPNFGRGSDARALGEGWGDILAAAVPTLSEHAAKRPVSKADIPALSEVAINDICHQTNPRKCTRADFERIFAEAM